MTASYIFGQGKPPRWLEDHLMYFYKADGSLGCELHTRRRVFVLDKGDVIRQKENGAIYVDKAKRQSAAG